MKRKHKPLILKKLSDTWTFAIDFPMTITWGRIFLYLVEMRHSPCFSGGLYDLLHGRLVLFFFSRNMSLIQEILLYWTTFSPEFIGILIALGIVLLILLMVRKFPNSWFSVAFSILFENMYEYFEDVLWKEERSWIKNYVTTTFFLLLIINVMTLLFDLTKYFVGDVEEITGSMLDAFVAMPTGTMAFNIVIALIWVAITIGVQAQKLGFRWFLHEYFPITGKGILVDKSSPTKPSIGAKIGDIVLSLFIGLLDIVWIFAKIISLSARLFGNMVSWTLLLAMLVFALASGSQMLFGIDSALFLPLILVAQWLLVWVIQAFVFPILIAIFVKVGQTD